MAVALDKHPYRMIPPPPDTLSTQSVQEGWRDWCGGRSVSWLKGGTSVAVTVASIAIRAMSYHYAVNVLTTIAIGVGFQCLVQTCLPNEWTPRIQQVSTTVFGQTPFFLIDALYANCKLITGGCPIVQPASLAVMGAMFGVNLAVYGKLLIDHRFTLQSDSDTTEAHGNSSREGPTEPSAEKFSPDVFWATKYQYPMKFFLGAASLTGWLFARGFEDDIIKGITSFFTLYYLSEPVTEYICEYVNNQIDHRNDPAIPQAKRLADLTPSRWNRWKTILNTLGYFAIPLAWIPWTVEPRTSPREAQLWIVGLVTGMFEGFVFRTQEDRLKNKPFAELDELQPRTPPKNTAFRVSRLAWAALIHVGMGIFVASQIGEWFQPMEKYDKISIGLMYAAYLGGSTINLIVNRVWNFQKRLDLAPRWQKFWDRRIVSQLLPRFCSINPFYIYLVVANSMKMRSGQTLDLYHQLLDWASWLCYGAAMADEHNQTWGEKRGTVFSFPKMFIANALLTVVPLLKGDES